MFTVYFSLLSPQAMVAGVVVYMLLGWLWYSPILFGHLWSKSMNSILKHPIHEGDMHAGHLVGAAFNGAFLTFCLAHIRAYAGVLTCTAAIEQAIWLWLGLVVTTHFSTVIWQKKPLAAYVIEMAHWAMTIVVLMCIVTQL